MQSSKKSPSPPFPPSSFVLSAGHLERPQIRCGQIYDRNIVSLSLITWQHNVLSQLPNLTQRQQLEELLVVKEGERYSPVDRLRHPPNRISAPALVAALNRLVEVRLLGIGTIDVTRVPPNRLKVLARSASAARSQAIARMPESRRIATMLAFVYLLEFTATDDALDLFDWLIGSVLNKSKSDGEKERLRTLKDLDAAALRLTQASEVLLDLSNKDADVRTAVFAVISAEKLALAVAKVKALVRPPEDKYYDLMLTRWRHVRLFLPKLLDTIKFEGTEAALANSQSMGISGFD